MSELEDDPLYRDPTFAQFYDAGCHPRIDFDYCIALARDATSVLDLGCGTGELAVAMADGKAVTGVDPAGAMLDIARERPGGDKVTWVEVDARSARLDRRFDLIVLTGHAYQVFLDDEDQRAVLATIAAHLEPGGRFIFDSRNPLVRSWQDWNRASSLRQLEHAQLGPLESWSEATFDVDKGIANYENWYRVLNTGKDYSASAQIRYTPKEKLAELIAGAGLVVDEWLGDWHGAPWTPDASEIIPVGRLG